MASVSPAAGAIGSLVLALSGALPVMNIWQQGCQRTPGAGIGWGVTGRKVAGTCRAMNGTRWSHAGVSLTPTAPPADPGRPSSSSAEAGSALPGRLAHETVEKVPAAKQHSGVEESAPPSPAMLRP